MSTRDVAVTSLAHKNHLQNRASVMALNRNFDTDDELYKCQDRALRNIVKAANKIRRKADHADDLDTMNAASVQNALVEALRNVLRESPIMQVIASKSAYIILRKRECNASRARSVTRGSQAMAIAVVTSAIYIAARETIFDLAILEHEKTPALVDESMKEEVDELEKRFAEERLAGLRVDPTVAKPWLFGPGAGVPPSERRRMADEEHRARRIADAKNRTSKLDDDPDLESA